MVGLPRFLPEELGSVVFVAQEALGVLGVLGVLGATGLPR